MAQPFRVGVTRDFLKPDGTLGFGDIGLQSLDDAPGVNWEFLADNTRELLPHQVQGYDALLVLAPNVTAASLAGADRLSVLARFGVGYDSVDVPACSANGVLLTITPDGVRRPVAAAVMTLLLALTHKLLIKDRLTRAGRWADKLEHMGQGVTGRTLGIIGLGNIGRDIINLARPFELRFLAFDPYLSKEQAAAAGAELVDLETLLRRSDYVSVNCALTPETHHMLNAERLALMQRNAYLINTARGPIVDQKALYQALSAGHIAGAGLDVFEDDPVDPRDPILSLDNVIVSPHAICWTDECFLGNGRSACESILDVAAGRVPRYVVNRDVLESPSVLEKLAAYGRQWEGTVRDNPVKRTIAGGGVALGTMVFEFNSTGIARAAAAAGAEFAIFDMEHSGWSTETIRTLVATTGGSGLVPMVRVPATQYHFIARSLDVGVMGIMVPNVETEEQARIIVRSAKYPPAGARGAGFGLAHDDYQGGDPLGTMQQSNNELLLIAQIESVRGVDDVDLIAATEGIDVLWVGHFDLTNSMGIPTQFTHPDYLNAVEQVIAACKRHGKTAGFMAANVDVATQALAQGFRILAYWGDVWIYQEGLRRGLDGIRAHLTAPHA